MVALLAQPIRGRRAIKDRRLLEAMRRVPRHEFVPPGSRDRSYCDSALSIAENQTISQPYVVALMSELLELSGEEKVLEVGTGSGYQAALLGELAAEVYTIEIRPALKEAAENKLRELKKRGVLHYRKLVTLVGDGSRGYPPAAPYDCILVTAAPSSIPEELTKQLKPGGRLVVPVGKEIQELQLVRKSRDGSSFSIEFVDFVRFVELVEEPGAEKE
jgi:protein-L-isoaspartate(D-aspartate) O-methyltransferase